MNRLPINGCGSILETHLLEAFSLLYYDKLYMSFEKIIRLHI